MSWILLYYEKESQMDFIFNARFRIEIIVSM